MTNPRYALFDTAIGRCGIAWGERGIVRIRLPETNEGATTARLVRGLRGPRSGPPPADVRRAIAAIAALLSGETSDLGGVALDMEAVPEFERRVYEAARAIPRGATQTYGEIARRIGVPDAAREVGRALGRNPFPIVVPCHRVVAVGGRSGGFSAPGGVATKRRMLAIEGAALGDQPSLFAEDGAPGPLPAAALRHLRAADARLARAIEAAGAFDLPFRTTHSVFVALAEAIVYQQLTNRAAETIFARVRALFPRARSGLAPRHLLAAGDARLRGAGLSRAKVLALRDLAERAQHGEIPTLAALRRMPDEAIVARLTQVRGIGRWTAQMLLVFRLGRPDVLAADDYALRRGFALVYGRRALPSRAELERHAERWAPYRTVASWALWRAAERAPSVTPSRASRRSRPTRARRGARRRSRAPRSSC